MRREEREESVLTDEQELIRLARGLDQTVLTIIFDTYYRPLYRYLYHHIGHKTTAEDLAAEVFTRLLEQIRVGRGPERYLKAWLYRVAHNLAVDELRKRAYRDHDVLDETVAASGQSVSELAHLAAQSQQARMALAHLAPRQRTVVILKFLEGLENDEIAQIMNLSVSAVKALQHRGLAALRRHLSRLGVEIEESV
jgi:RNA polymerase sigma-70 factor (ECF subfamily)